MDVRLPDGTIIQGVPEGTSRAELIEKLRRNGYDVSKLGAPVSETPAVQQPQVPTFDPMGMPTGMTEAAPTPTPMGYSEQMEKSALSMARQALKAQRSETMTVFRRWRAQHWVRFPTTRR